MANRENNETLKGTLEEKETRGPKEELKEETNNTRKVRIEIVKYEKLVKILGDNSLSRNLLGKLVFIVAVFFLGLTGILLTIKYFFPYNTIETTQYGAVIVKNEDKDVVYWLLNAADVWANSGVKVKKGDELTIRSSGASHTAIHHLVKNADENKVLSDAWVDADGQEKHGERDSLRALFRLAPNYPESMLLMRVFPSEKQNKKKEWVYRQEERDLKAGELIAIGKESRNIVMPCDGVLHFMVNDILLTDSTIMLMYEKYVEKLCEIRDRGKQEVEKVDSIKIKKEILKCIRDIKKDSNSTIIQNAYASLILLNKSYKFNLYADSCKKKGFAFADHPERKGGYPLITELLYYKETKFRDAWYADNLGSFLIVIERKREK